MASITRTSTDLNPTIAGLLFFLAGSLIIMGIITGEMFYPAQYGYTTAKNMISDLGATEPPNSLITQPSATIFNTTMMFTGVLTLIGACFVFKTYKDLIVTILMGLMALGVLGVGIFPGNMNPMHPIFAMCAFVCGGLAAIVSYRIIRSPFRYAAIVFGLVTLFFLVANGYFIPILGGGGVERWIAYPVVLWVIGIGGYMLGYGSQKEIKAE
jgi:hypothetical membrane protein